VAVATDSVGVCSLSLSPVGGPSSFGGQRFSVLVGARGFDKRNTLRGDWSGILALDEKYKGICS
jgi:hypothetical protein